MRKLFIALTLAALVCLPLSAQTYLASTTLASAITSLSTTTIFLTSTAGITTTYCGGSLRGCGLFVDREFMTVTDVPVSGQVRVTRAVAGTTGSLHAALRTVIIGPQNVFSGSDYDGITGRSPGGPCTATLFTYLPIVNVTNGNVWLCRPGVVSINGSTNAAAWVATNTSVITYNSLITSLP